MPGWLVFRETHYHNVSERNETLLFQCNILILYIQMVFFFRSGYYKSTSVLHHNYSLVETLQYAIHTST